MSAAEDNVEIVKAYFAAMQESPGAVSGFYHPEIVQDEFPNRFLPNGIRRGLRELQEAAERGRAVMAS